MTFVLTSIGDLDADGAFARDGRQHVDALGLERGGDVVAQVGNLLQLDPGRGVQFVAGDGRPLGDVAQGNLDVELRQVCCIRRALAINSSFDSVGLAVMSGSCKKSNGGRV